MSLINREALYEKACDLEAQALAYVGKIVNDETKIEEWRIWSAILAERTAFKHDIFDAPEVKPERKTGKWILADTYAGKRYRCSECLAFALKTDDGQENLSDYCPVCGAEMEGEDDGTD